MGENTKIEWCDHSWSPWRGCTKVSPGCAHCYAETLGKRFPKVMGEWGKGKPRVLAKNWSEAVKWNKAWNKAQYFCRVQGQLEPPKPTVFPSLCDWLDDEVPVKWLSWFLMLIYDTPNLRWLLLTKRPENFKTRLAEVLADKMDGPKWDAWEFVDNWITGKKVPSNIWVGTSVEDQIRADERIPKLLDIPAAGRFLSVEPLLGPVDLTRIEDDDGNSLDALTGDWAIDGRGHTGPSHTHIDWVIVGGESGPAARPCNVEWIRAIVRQCKHAGVPCFVKQLGSVPVQTCRPPYDSETDTLKLKHPKGGDPAEWPEDLRVREFPWGGAK